MAGSGRKRPRVTAADDAGDEIVDDAGPSRNPAMSDSEDNGEAVEAAIEENLMSDGEEEESEGEDLLAANMMDDYRPIERLDRYEVDSQAEAEEGSLSIGARRAAENELRDRDVREGRAQAVSGLQDLGRWQDEDPNEDADNDADRRQRRRLLEEAAASSRRGGQDRRDSRSRLESSSLVGEEGDDFDIENYRGPLREWIKLARPRRELRKRFSYFLRETKDAQTSAAVYLEAVRIMCTHNRQSIVVSYRHLSSADPLLAVWVADAPAEMLTIFDEVAAEVTLSEFPNYDRIHHDIYVRISDLPIVDNLRDIRHIHLNCLVKVNGVITRRTGMFPHMKLVKLDCQKCRATLVPSSFIGGRPEHAVSQCPECGSRGPFKVNSEQTIFGSFQRMTIQESPGSVPAGRLPRQKDVVLLADLVDCARPGDEVEVTGIYRHTHDVGLNIKNGFPVFSTVIEANHVRKTEDSTAQDDMTDDDIAEMRKLSQDPRIAERIVASIAPSIYGHKDIKNAIAMSLFGGQAKEVGERHRIRGDINVLLLGDPGTAKSQFLKYVEKTANRAVYTTGKGASAVGLTAAVRKDAVSREWVLEGGALVLADKGTCLIDEFDKMNEQDRTSIHEAMEQQTISISKAGIVTTLQARCSVMAAANPVKGRYDASLNFLDNVDLTEPILSRFDVLCVVRDMVDPLVDERLARFVVNSHAASHTDQGNQASQGGQTRTVVQSDDDVESISQPLFRKYLRYARKTTFPKLGGVDQEKISRLYLDLRRESLSSGGMPIALRHLESIVRMSEARARMHLRNFVTDDDVNAAISVMLNSFFHSQKYSVMRGLRRNFSKYLTYKKNDFELLFYIASRLVRDYMTAQSVDDSGSPAEVAIDLDDFEARSREVGVSDTRSFLRSSVFRERGFRVDEDARKIIKAL